MSYITKARRDRIRNETEPGPWNDGASGSDILRLLDHIDAAEALLREAVVLLEEAPKLLYGNELPEFQSDVRLLVAKIRAALEGGP